MSKREWRADPMPNGWMAIAIPHEGREVRFFVPEGAGRLIAAAPDMAEALERAKGELVYMKEKMPHTNAADAFRMVIAALKKAGVIK